MNSRLPILMILLLLTLVSIVSGCVGAPETAQVELTLGPESALPNFLQDAPVEVKEVYRFAIANPDVLSKMPCYCGCGAMGHQNNLQCYIKEVRADGSIEFEPHAYG